jgi:uncharacterized protein YdaU (DUF1376 family)
MAEFPALPIFTDAFISDTTHLTSAQTGAYFMLLMMAWRTKENALPDDDEKLSRWARMDRRTWAMNKAVIMSFWKKDEQQLWRQGRLDDERKRADHVRRLASQAGKASALKRQGRHSTDVQRNVNGTSTPSPSPSPSPSTTVKDSPLIPPLTNSDSKSKTEANGHAEPSPKRKRTPPTPISDDFQPDIEALALAGDLNIEVEPACREFIDYWKSTGKCFVDWQATFRNRLRQLEKYRAERSERENTRRPNVRDVTGATLRAIKIHEQNKT